MVDSMTVGAVDKLVISGVDGLDGSYDTDILALLSVGEPGALTSREAHRIKLLTGITGGGLFDAFSAGDTDVLVGLAAVILSRLGKEYDDDALWDSPMGAITFDIAERKDEDDADPPVSEPDVKPPTVEPSTSGGGSSATGSDAGLGNARKPTGAHA